MIRRRVTVLGSTGSVGSSTLDLMARAEETGTGAFPPMPRRDGAHATELSLILGLMLGAIWPWLGTAHPAIAFLLSLAMLVCFLGAAFQGRDRPRGEASSTLGFVTGWALLACLSLFAATIERLASVPQTAAAVLADLLPRLDPETGAGTAVTRVTPE